MCNIEMLTKAIETDERHCNVTAIVAIIYKYVGKKLCWYVCVYSMYEKYEKHAEIDKRFI